MKRTLKIVGCCLLIVLGVLGLLQVLPVRDPVKGANPWRSKGGTRPLLIAHGGGQAMEPPNTIEAFAASVALGSDVLEMDLRLTKDNVMVTLHDETVDRTSDGKGRAADYTLAELLRLNFGHQFKDPQGREPYRNKPAHLIALESLFQRFPTIPMIVELKDRGETGARAGELLFQLIERHHRETNVIVASFDDPTLEHFQRVSGGKVAVSAPLNATRQFVVLNLLRLGWFAPSGYDALQVPVAKQGFHLDAPSLIGQVHRRNMAIHYWTINDPAEMRRLIGLGADGIMTDRPDLLKAVMEELHLR